MKKCKEHLTPGFRKCGYLKVGRNVLKAFFSGYGDQRHLASVLLCVQTFVYFSEGVIILNDFSYTCRPGEWVTSFTEISTLTGLCRKSVKKCLERLQSYNFLQVKDVGCYKLIILMNYEQLIEVKREPAHTPEVPSEGNSGEASLFDLAESLYSNVNPQRGGVN